MCPSRCCVRLALSLAAIAAVVSAVRARRGAEVWHVAPDPSLVTRLGTRFAMTRGLSSVGRAPPLQGGCQGFDSPRLHSVMSRVIGDR